jgi:hypothetical protein
MMRWKDSVRFDALHPAMVLAMIRAEVIYEDVGAECWVTSGNDSAHMVGSKHYDGRAVDFRVHHVPDETTREAIANTLRAALGAQFTVLYEGAGTGNAHIHCQFNGQ